VDAGEDAASWDGRVVEQLVELIVEAHRELHVARGDAAALVVAGGVASKLENFCRKVFEHSRKIHGSAGTDADTEVGILEVAVHAANWELEASPAGPSLVGPGLDDVGSLAECLAQLASACMRGRSKRSGPWK
jgi:hypothetical protein